MCGGRYKPCVNGQTGKNENVTTGVLEKICIALQCDIGDIMELTNSDEMTGNSKSNEYALQAKPVLK